MGKDEDKRIFNYRIDAENHITFLNREWVDFAKENEAPELIPEHVLGQDLAHFIADWETRHLYEVIYERVRQTGREISIPFRCDSPDRRRYFKMRIAPLPSGGLDFSVNVIRIEQRPPVSLLDNSVEHSAVIVVICSWCKRIKAERGRWMEVEDFSEDHELFGAIPPSLTHGVCPDCLSIFRRQLDEG